MRDEAPKEQKPEKKRNPDWKKAENPEEKKPRMNQKKKEKKREPEPVGWRAQVALSNRSRCNRSLFTLRRTSRSSCEPQIHSENHRYQYQSWAGNHQSCQAELLSPPALQSSVHSQCTQSLPAELLHQVPGSGGLDARIPQR